jgi:hypothetical protein
MLPMNTPTDARTLGSEDHRADVNLCNFVGWPDVLARVLNSDLVYICEVGLEAQKHSSGRSRWRDIGPAQLCQWPCHEFDSSRAHWQDDRARYAKTKHEQALLKPPCSCLLTRRMQTVRVYFPALDWRNPSSSPALQVPNSSLLPPEISRCPPSVPSVSSVRGYLSSPTPKELAPALSWSVISPLATTDKDHVPAPLIRLLSFLLPRSISPIRESR